MKILITGGLGHIGSKLIRDLDKKYELTIVDNLSTQRYCSLFDINRNYKFIENGFENLTLEEINNFDIVIHLAAITDAVYSVNNKELVWETNVNKTKNFIDLIEKSNIKLVIFPSSTSVYGDSTKEVKEDNNKHINPQSPYAEGKIEIENYLKKQSINYVILRLGTIFGTSIGMRFHTVINKFCYQASFNQPLTIWDICYEQYRPYLGLEDLLQALNLIIDDENKWNETYNVLTGNFKLKEIVEYIKDIIDIEVKMVKTPLLNQHSYKVNDDKIRRIGFLPKESLFTNINKTIKKFKNG